MQEQCAVSDYRLMTFHMVCTMKWSLWCKENGNAKKRRAGEKVQVKGSKGMTRSG